MESLLLCFVQNCFFYKLDGGVEGEGSGAGSGDGLVDTATAAVNTGQQFYQSWIFEKSG